LVGVGCRLGCSGLSWAPGRAGPGPGRGRGGGGERAGRGERAAETRAESSALAWGSGWSRCCSPSWCPRRRIPGMPRRWWPTPRSAAGSTSGMPSGCRATCRWRAARSGRRSNTVSRHRQGTTRRSQPRDGESPPHGRSANADEHPARTRPRRRSGQLRGGAAVGFGSASATSMVLGCPAGPAVWVTWIRRGCAVAATGMVTCSTPLR